MFGYMTKRGRTEPRLFPCGVGGADARARAREEGAWRYEVEQPARRLLSHGSNTERRGGAERGGK